MLGRLIQTAASYGKGSTTLESATEEAHTRNLLYGQSQNLYPLSQSPPTSPFVGPTFRPGSYDDRGGLELEEKDLRILIAQDAFGVEEKPSVLFDSNIQTQPASSHQRHASTAQIGQRSPLPNDWKPGPSQQQGNIQSNLPFRNRSSTLSNASTAWSRPVRDAGTREEAFLECMFGVTSSTKTTSTIKMHVVPGQPRISSPGPGRNNAPMDQSDTHNRRAPLARSRTSNMVPRTQPSPLSGSDNDTSANDVVLITRLFHVALAEAVGTTRKDHQPTNSSGELPATSSAVPSPSTEGAQQTKKPKLVERKVPAFAVGLVLYLPRSPDPRSPSVRPTSHSTFSHSVTSPPGSIGSEVQSPWTFLNAIPESLASSRLVGDEGDRRIDTIVNNWDVILRAISLLEREATIVLREQLERNLNQMFGGGPKTPKEKSMQRINQRIISITDPTVIARKPLLQRTTGYLLKRICYALRIPRVVTGLGFAAGHWSDEARNLYRICGRRQQNFFLFSLLTAFLGQHTQWLQRLAPDWHRKQSRAVNKKRPDAHALVHRTIIVSDQRAIARRLIFVLASFFPGVSGLDGLHKVGEDPVLSGHFSTSSPSSQVARNESLRRTVNRRMRENRLQASMGDKAVLSTSASSTDSATQYMPRDRSARYLVRRDSDGLSIRLPHNSTAVSEAEQQLGRASLATASTTTPNPATPVPFFSTRQESYFPEGATAEYHESLASADLAKILRRSSSSAGNSSNISSRWGSLVSGISDLWSAKYPQSGGASSAIPSSPVELHFDRGKPQNMPRKSGSSDVLQDLIGEMEGEARPPTGNTQRSVTPNSKLNESDRSPFKSLVTAPRLKVDDKDGVIDVDLDLPGFLGFSIDNVVTSPTKRSHRPSTASFLDGSDSVRSLRSIPTLSPKAPVIDDTGVAGFLRRHHEDFTLQAVRPYSELEEEIKQSMSQEPSPTLEWNEEKKGSGQPEWTDICTTLVADARTFTIRRITLRRKLRPRASSNSTLALTTDLVPVDPQRQDRSERPPSPLDQEDEMFIEEDIKEFDTMLADAVERVLNLTEALQLPSALVKSPRMGHSRSASASTTLTARSSATNTPSKNAGAGLPAISQDFVKQDCRQVVLGALEEVVKDVNDDLSKLQKGRNIRDRVPVSGSLGASSSNARQDKKQDNVLREGIKRWLLDVEYSKVW